MYRYSLQAHRRAQRVLASSAPSLCLSLTNERPLKIGLSVLLLNKDSPQFLEVLLPQLQAAKNLFNDENIFFEILIGDTGSTDVTTLAMYSAFSSCEIKVVDVGPYHFSANNNTLVSCFARGSALLFLNNDIEFVDPSCLLHMYKQHVRDSRAVQGSELLYPDGSVQHGGVGFLRHDHGIFAYHLRHRQRPEYAEEPQVVPALTGALLLLSRYSFIAVGGFDVAYADECQDIDLCLKLQRLGCPMQLHRSSKVIHHENGTRVKGEENWADRSLFNNKWSSFLEIHPELLPR